MMVSVFIAVSRGKGGPSESEVSTTPVVVETAQRGTLVERVHLTGDIKGQNQADIYPDVPGRLNRVYVREGQYVSQGQVVADIDRNVVGMVYRPATVTAPISGVIGKIYVDVGMTIAPNVPMMLIADTRVVEGILAVPEKFVPYFQVGQTAEVRLQSYPDEVFSGTISNKGSMIDPATRTLQVRIRLSNPGGKILPGNYADFSVQIREARDQVKVPFDAVIDTIERQFVLLR
jgi:membrane fusion protein, multidrug efflux system